MTAVAKSCGVSAARKWRPDSSARPSAPTVVETTALPIASASKILMRVPLPARSGTTYTDASPIDGRTSPIVPVTITPGCVASPRTRALGLRPTIVNDTAGASARIRGRIVSTK
jgi:hypothetical protein